MLGSVILILSDTCSSPLRYAAAAILAGTLRAKEEAPALRVKSWDAALKTKPV